MLHILFVVLAGLGIFIGLCLLVFLVLIHCAAMSIMMDLSRALAKHRTDIFP